MVNSIGGASAAPATYSATPAAIPKTDTEGAAITTAAAAVDATQTPPAPTQSAESAAAARLGDQLNAEADAARVQRAVDESTTEVETGEATEGAGAEAATAQAPAAAAAGAGGAGVAGGGAAASQTTDTDYIAEADTNSDKTVSDQERVAYEATLRKETETQAEVRAAYGQDEGAEPALDVTA